VDGRGFSRRAERVSSAAPMHAPARIPYTAHSSAYRRRRFANWFPLGLTYALLYMGRYNLTVAKNALGELLTKEDFGVIFGAGTVVYALAFVLNGPLVDRYGGRKGMLAGAFGAMAANFAMGAYVYWVVNGGQAGSAPLRLVLSALYALNMYFQSFGAVSIVKINAHWFHVSERGGFSGVFGTMIASGIFLAFTGNSILLKLAQVVSPSTPALGQVWVVFAIPGALLLLLAVIELFLLRDRPSEAGYQDFDTGDASSGDTSDTPIPTLALFKRILANPIIMTIALIEFCTGVLRNGVMHWFPIYATEIWALPMEHDLQGGILVGAIRDWSWKPLWPALPCFAVGGISAILAARTQGRRRACYAIGSAVGFLAPFMAGGWGGILMVAGVVGGNLAGWVSDWFFQSRRGPVAGALYGFLVVCALGLWATLATPTNVVAAADAKSGLLAGDRILAIGADQNVRGWKQVRDAVACVPPTCQASGWDPERCMCVSARKGGAPPASSVIFARIERNGTVADVELPDPKPVQRAGDTRFLKARPTLPLSPYWMGLVVFLVSLSVIGTHGVLSGTATMDFGGRKGAATAVGVIDGFVYLGTALQSVALGYLTTKSWSYWPWFLLPFGVIGLVLCTRIWHAKPKGRGAH
jgi:sugar phosphate permease